MEKQEEQPVIYNAIYADGHFEKVRLGELVNKGGAAGKIYMNLANPNSVAKIFHKKSKSSTNRKKLEAMLLNRPNFPPASKTEPNMCRLHGLTPYLKTKTVSASVI